jgi:shikimate dehydrogenase
VLGWPLAHTLSPALHQAAYRAAGWTAGPTRPPDPPEELAAALDEVRRGRLAGVNLTTPHKQPAAALVDDLERPADRLEAVNTVFVREGRLVGGNTDVAGAVWALGSQLGLRDDRWPGTGPAVLLGTGGVALAVAFAWSRLATRRRHQGLPAPPLGSPAATPAGPRPWPPGRPGRRRSAGRRRPSLVAAADVVLQATTLTARGEPVPGQDRLRPGVRVLDCNYGPASQGLVAAARTAGAAAAADGLGMLCAQAARRRGQRSPGSAPRPGRHGRPPCPASPGRPRA